MLKLKPQFLKKNGKTQFVILTAREFSALEGLIEDAIDIKILKKSRKKNAGKRGISLEDLKRELGIMQKPRKAKA